MNDVALLAEGVGRNGRVILKVIKPHVALLAEGVGRNHPVLSGAYGYAVALLAEGVGRNSINDVLAAAGRGRPPRGGRG